MSNNNEKKKRGQDFRNKLGYYAAVEMENDMDEYNGFYSFSDSLFSSQTCNNYSEVSPQHLRHDVNRSMTNTFTSPFDINTILSERRTPNLIPTATIGNYTENADIRDL